MSVELGEPEETGERRKTNIVTILGFKFDKTINLGGACALVVLLYSLYTGFNSLKAEFIVMQRQHSLMWKHFVMHEQDITKEELNSLIGDASK